MEVAKSLTLRAYSSLARSATGLGAFRSRQGRTTGQAAPGRSADFQSAVSQAFSLLCPGRVPTSQRYARLPTTSRRYSRPEVRPEVCATGEPLCRVPNGMNAHGRPDAGAPRFFQACPFRKICYSSKE
jgi:hypothetical protein